MKTLLVTGGAGFIGGTFIRRVVPRGDVRVVNLDSLTYAGNLASLAAVEAASNYEFVHGDIRDSKRVRDLIERIRPDAVVHFAAESHVDRSIGAPATFIETNVVGTQNLLEEVRHFWASLDATARDAFRFLHVSTDEVYGTLGPTGKFTEETQYAPNSPYSASKAASDHLVRAYFHTYGLPTLISNCSNNYGPFQFPEKLIPLMILNALEGKPLPVYGDGLNIRDWLHVEDHCQALECVLERGRPGEVYNIGGDAERTNLDVVKTICRCVDELRPELPHTPCFDLVTYVADRPGHDRRYAIDATKIQQELGWRPEHDFETGIRETVAWYLDHPTWVQQVTDGSYQRQRLGLLAAASRSGDGTVGRRTSWPAPKTYAADSYTDGPIEGVDLRDVRKFQDDRGWLVEIFREDEVAAEFKPVMAYLSETRPGVARGPHEHHEQADLFAFLGPGSFDLYLWDSRPKSPTFGNRMVCRVGEDRPCTVIVPPGVVHAYRNAGNDVGWVFNAPNQLYAGWGKAEPVDEIRHEDDPQSAYQMTTETSVNK